MWKRLDEAISTSEKWARLNWSTMAIGMYILANSDSKGRYDGDARVIKARCMTYREDVRLEIIEDALSELERERVLHVYHVGQKRYVVFHDCLDWNPPGALRYNAPKYPDPPPELCPCLEGRRESGVKTPLVSSPSLSSSTSSSGEGGCRGEGDTPPSGHIRKRDVKNPQDQVYRHLWDLAKRQRVIAKDETLATYLQGWIAQKGGAEVERILMEPRCRGRAILDIQRWYFDGMKMAGE